MKIKVKHGDVMQKGFLLALYFSLFKSLKVMFFVGCQLTAAKKVLIITNDFSGFKRDKKVKIFFQVPVWYC